MAFKSVFSFLISDTRANLEISISKVLKLYANLLDALHKNKLKFHSTHTTESDDEEQLLEEPPNELIRAVRKDLACALRDLMQHGLVELSRTSTLAPFGCFVGRSQTVQAQMHVWDLLMKYFDIKVRSSNQLRQQVDSQMKILENMD